MERRVDRHRTSAERWLIAIVAAIATVAVFSALTVAGSVFAPVVCALFIIAVTWPLQAWLQARIPQLLALAIVISVVVALFLVFASLTTWGFTRVVRALIADAARFQALYEQLNVWLEGHGIAMAGLLTEHFNVGWLIRAVQDVTGRVNTTITFWLIVLVYVILGLLEVEPIARKLRALFAPAVSKLLIEGSAVTSARFRRYMLIRTVMSFATGFFVWVVASAFGLPLAAEWGVIAFALNYIPFIGPFVATLFPTLYALAQFSSWQSVLALFAGLNVVQFVIGSYIEPRVSGSALAVSPFIVLFSVFLWAYLWGLFGAFIGVPVTIALLSYCAQHPSSRWVADLFGAPEDAVPAKRR